ncbi:hypothetical protein [uncultured Tateyamaria sp.]|uniref:hypothetical protein n=1 Tax=uncultured Tateyamaria sp. TaxID=455651 RepID=UPI002628FB31|nr:hypothetical protein [uncultured Tateyamaria sp.]
MRGLFTYGGSALLVGVVLWAAAALLPACGVGNSIAARWIDWCPVNKSAALDAQIAVLAEKNRTLERAILQRERELAQKQCEIPELAQNTPEEIDRDAWDSGRVSLLEGCWDLDSRFATTNQSTGEQSTYTQWTMCFDADGRGREEMRANNGNTCSGAVQAGFEGDGALSIEEPGDLQCSDGGYIYRLSSRCTLKDDGNASCVVSQPEVGGRTTVEFRRSAREN